MWDKAIRAAKRDIRSELSVSKGHWSRLGYARQPALVCAEGQAADTVPRVHCSWLSVEEFVERFERPRQPVVITGLQDSWRAPTEWTLDKLLQRYGRHRCAPIPPVPSCHSCFHVGHFL